MGLDAQRRVGAVRYSTAPPRRCPDDNSRAPDRVLGRAHRLARARAEGSAPRGLAGPHAVGFTHIVLEPTTAVPRRVTLGAGFARASSRGDTVRFGELWALAQREDPEVPASAASAPAALQLAAVGDSAPPLPALERTLRWSTTALRDGDVLRGSHPLVLWACAPARSRRRRS